MADRFTRTRRPGGPERPELLERWVAVVPDETALWQDLRPGPPLQEVATRIARTPAALLDAPVDLPALVADVLGDHPEAHRALDLARTVDDAAATRTAAIAVWVWASESLLGPVAVPLRDANAVRVLAAFAFRLAAASDAASAVGDSDRREEAARLLLLASGLLPAGERADAARSLFARYDGVRRSRALRTALDDLEHRSAVLARLADARAREAAARYAPE